MELQLSLTFIMIAAAGFVNSEGDDATPQVYRTFYPCVDDSSTCKIHAKYASYCKTNPFARATCCLSCAMKLGFTAKVTQATSAGSDEVHYINVVDLTSAAALSWLALPKTNEIYPGLSRLQTNKLCSHRAKFYGLKRFCKDKVARTICGSTCLNYNYPS